MRTQTTTQQRNIVEVMAAHGVELVGHGDQLKGCCPFHEDKTPSLSVNREKGVWNCFGCGAKGNAKVFEARMSGRLVTGRDLIEKVMKPANAGLPGSGNGKAIETIADVGAVIERVVSLYHEALSKNKAALEYLTRRGVGDMELLRRYRVGFSDGSLRKLAPPRSATWNTLRNLGYINERGYELMSGCVVFPITDAAGSIVNMYGRRVVEKQGAPKHMYPGAQNRGVWNREGAKAAAVSGAPVIVCEGVIDALSCVVAEYSGAIALYGTNGIKPDHIELLREIAPAKITLLLDGDKGGRDAVPVLLERFAGLAKELVVARLPEEKEQKDPNGILVKMGTNALQYFIEKAEAIAPRSTAAIKSTAVERIDAESAPTVATAEQALIEHSSGDLTFTTSKRTYHVKNFNAFGFARMRATILLANKDDGTVHIDTLDLYSNRSRSSFVSEASARVGIDAATIEADLLNLTLALDEHRKAAAEKMRGKTKIATYVMTPEEKAAGMEFLTASDLIAEIVRDCEAVGYVGEAKNKALAYLIATSRKMREPLSAILIATSGAGKSALLDVVESIMPAEDLYAVSDMTENALFYVPDGDLSHKLLIIAERNGSEGADYSLRELQTKRSLSKAVAVKDPETGNIKTILITVRGPVAVMESTTNPRMNPENSNRCFVLHVDESREQTVAIQNAQRRAKSMTAFCCDDAREVAVMRHRAAQRLLEPLRVVIPFAEHIKFPADSVRTRRDHARFLNLIEAVTFLSQKKRARKEHNGTPFIEATLDDYGLARSLALEVLTANLDELPRASRELLDAMNVEAEKRTGESPGPHPKKRDTVLFTRRDLTTITGWTYDRIRGAIGPLLDHECVTVERGSRGVAMYRLGAILNRPEVMLPEMAELAAQIAK